MATVTFQKKKKKKIRALLEGHKHKETKEKTFSVQVKMLFQHLHSRAAGPEAESNQDSVFVEF